MGASKKEYYAVKYSTSWPWNEKHTKLFDNLKQAETFAKMVKGSIYKEDKDE